MAKTIAEKIFSKKSGQDVKADDVVVAAVDYVLTNDASGPLAIDFFLKMEETRVERPDHVIAVLDHYVPCPNRKVAGLQQMLYDFRDKYGIRVEQAGEGIAHQVFDELGCVFPGALLVGGDSHTTTHGYLGCLGIGIGASDLACAMASGELWFRVPETIHVVLEGKPAPGISGKDIALWLLAQLGGDGANYQSLEFGGSGLSYLSMDDRKTICNLGAECCAKCAVMPIDDVARAYCLQRGIPLDQVVESDLDCTYCKTITVDLAQVPPMVALPHSADHACPLSEQAGMPVDMVVIGTCTNGRISDFEAVDAVLQSCSGPFQTETLVIPASRTIYREMLARGYAARLLERGAMILPPSCGPCCGSSPGVPRDGLRVVSTANRNFLGRMGNASADIYLTSPAVAAATALRGCLTDPKELMEHVSV